MREGGRSSIAGVCGTLVTLSVTKPRSCGLVLIMMFVRHESEGTICGEVAELERKVSIMLTGSRRVVAWRSFAAAKPEYDGSNFHLP